jgi:hypothetical protein
MSVSEKDFRQAETKARREQKRKSRRQQPTVIQTSSAQQACGGVTAQTVKKATPVHVARANSRKLNETSPVSPNATARPLAGHVEPV